MDRPDHLRCWVGPSILDADLGNLTGVCQQLLDSGADYLHLDVMDGAFVPNLTFGHPVVRCVRKGINPEAFIDLHMMVQKPEQWVEQMANAATNASQYTFHIEATDDVEGMIRKVREADMKVGVALKPNTCVEAVLPYVDQIDTVLIMTVEPGFGGQRFMPEMLAKVELLRQRYRTLDIEIDGGVGPANIDQCSAAGANMIVSGNAIVNNTDPRSVINTLRRSVIEAVGRSNLER